MRLLIHAVVCTIPLLAGVVAVRAEPVSLQNSPEYSAARRALAGKLPSIAVEKSLALLEDGKIVEKDLPQLRLLLVEAAVRAAKVDVLPSLTEQDLPDTMAAKFWLAQALALNGSLSQAESLLAKVSSGPEKPLQGFAALARASLLVALREPESALAALAPAGSGSDKSLAFKARLRQAEIHLQLGQTDQAKSAMEKLPAAPSPADAAAADYLRARIDEALGDHAGAIKEFEKIAARPRNLPTRIVHASLLGSARSLSAAGQSELATDNIIAFVNRYPDSPILPAAFAAMEKAGVFADPSRRADIENWEKSPNPGLATLSVLHRARANGVPRDKALRYLEAVMTLHAKSPLVTAVALRRAELLIEENRIEEAQALLASLDETTLNAPEQALRTFLNAQTKQESGNPEQAAADFALAADQMAPSDPADAIAARFNAGLATLLRDDSGGFEDNLAKLLDGGGEATAFGARLLLERGLYLSSRSPGTARLHLWRYLQAAPESSERTRAYLVLAEIALRENPPAPEKAQRQLEKIGPEAPDAVLERRDYLLVWTEDLAKDTSAAVAAANKFLARWPDSFLAEEVRFKTGAMLAADGQHAAARAYFEILAEKTDSPWREQAIFQSARSASLSLTETSLEQAITLFQKVVDLKGPLTIAARQEQTRLLVRQGKMEAAIALLKETLDSKPAPDAQVKRSLLSQLAEILLERHEVDPDALAESGRIFNALATDPDAGLAWRNRAFWFMGRTAMAMEKPDEALRVWYDAMDQSLPPGQPPLETDWAFRCGMSAVELLSKRQEWPAAAALADRLGKSGAPRAAEAATLHERLRLEHFLWDQPEAPATRNGNGQPE
ncbi:MAG: tetratricopeptide repeat protein [Verrucomicrobiales bacterium]